MKQSPYRHIAFSGNALSESFFALDVIMTFDSGSRKPENAHWMGKIECARAHFHRWRSCPASFCTLGTCLPVKIFLPRQLTSTIFIRFVNFIDRKCSLDSELSEFEGIIVIGDIYWILERSATEWRLISRSRQCVSSSLLPVVWTPSGAVGLNSAPILVV